MWSDQNLGMQNGCTTNPDQFSSFRTLSDIVKGVLIHHPLHDLCCLCNLGDIITLLKNKPKSKYCHAPQLPGEELRERGSPQKDSMLVPASIRAPPGRTVMAPPTWRTQRSLRDSRCLYISIHCSAQQAHPWGTLCLTQDKCLSSSLQRNIQGPEQFNPYN